MFVVFFLTMSLIEYRLELYSLVYITFLRMRQDCSHYLYVTCNKIHTRKVYLNNFTNLPTTDFLLRRFFFKQSAVLKHTLVSFTCTKLYVCNITLLKKANRFCTKAIATWLSLPFDVKANRLINFGGYWTIITIHYTYQFQFLSTTMFSVKIAVFTQSLGVFS